MSDLSRHSRARATLWLVLLSGCPDAHDPELEPPEPDAGLDAGPDARVDIDAGDAGPQRDLDARALLDAALDAAQEASCTLPAIPGCTPRGPAEVQCGSATCSGDTPVCCEHADVDPSVAPSCIAIGARCEGSRDVTANIVNACDDANDCPAGWVCVDGFNKGLNHNNGARCVEARDAFCRELMFPGGPFYSWQRCRADCECASGQRCQQNKCVAR